MAQELQSTGDILPIAADAVAIARPYAKGKAINLGVTTIGAGAAANADIVTAGYQWVILMYRIGNATTPATAAGDISGYLAAYEDDGVTLFPNGLAGGVGAWANDATMNVRAATLNTPYATFVQRINIAGVDKVNVRLINGNAAPLQGGTVIYYLQK